MEQVCLVSGVEFQKGVNQVVGQVLVRCLPEVENIISVVSRAPEAMSIRETKSVVSLQVSDLKNHPVWQFVTDDEEDETAVRPVNRLPVSSLEGRIIGMPVRLAKGRSVWAIIGNLDTKNTQKNEHFVLLSIERKGKWFQLERYFDPKYREHGPKALARFLGLSLVEVFPISYDVRKYAKGESSALTGTIPRKPRVRLTKAALVTLAVPEAG
jgi:hypothetical protein